MNEWMSERKNENDNDKIFNEWMKKMEVKTEKWKWKWEWKWKW